jgi:hypothetical protein
MSWTDDIDVEAYDRIQVTVDAGATLKVDLAPAASANSPVKLLVISPEKPDAKLTYGSDVQLDGPHILLGQGAVSLLGGAATLDFKNGTDAPARIDILVGRDATPA